MSGHALFDLDGTLVDSLAICTNLLNEMLADRGCARRVCTEQVRPYVSIGGARMVEIVLGEECGDVGRTLLEFRARYAERATPTDSLYPGVREGLAQLRDEGFVLAICSNKPQKLCEKVLRDLDLISLFEVVVGTGPGMPSKPAPDLFLAALNRSGGEIGRSCLVGDSALDHALAKGLGVPLIFVTYGYSEADWDFGDAVSCDNFTEVPALVRAVLALAGPETRLQPA